ncbi:uncharacterized protein LOC102807159 [Saccoglossus kowalevskii]
MGAITIHVIPQLMSSFSKSQTKNHVSCWLRKIGRGTNLKVTTRTRLCSDHFEDKHFERDLMANHSLSNYMTGLCESCSHVEAMLYAIEAEVKLCKSVTRTEEKAK